MSRHESTSNARAGLTLIEAIVVLVILVVLAALFLPVTRSARVNSRRVHCLNNMRNVGLAMQNYASWNNGDLPTLTSIQPVTNSNGAGTMTVG